ncbi:MAG: DUF433 domain-containing protein [Janthinobacterium lividum]
MGPSDEFWNDCDLLSRDAEVVSGAPVLKGTRLPAEALIANVESFLELEGMSEDQAIMATLEIFPGIPGGEGTLRSLLAYQAMHLPQLQP